ncbi:EthD protein [Caballeronia calidae]|uniref:EthD protein n=1 Tax=Caballeronia calidae TaxID=1777139 RepID=A0A158E0H7_9BURK|nr:EthD family reductase [Caballeronia calidae]SAL00273.1 EthD protein [Caballeronia calidae]
MSKVRMGLIYKKPEWSTEDFKAHWLNHHGSLVKRAPGLSQYWQNHVTDRVQRGIEFARGPWEFDGFSQLWVADPEAPFGRDELPAQILADESYFMGGLNIVSVQQTTVVEVPNDDVRRRLMKRMSIIRRRPEMSEQDFLREWKVHADYVRTMPGVLGYRQNAIVEREVTKGSASTYEELPIDGIVEFWFESTDSLQNAFGSEAGLKTMAHAKTFLSEITAFLVDEHRIV